MGVRSFGSPWRKKRPGGGYHPGYYISFHLPIGPRKRKRFKKYGGDTKAAARRVLSRIETLLAERKSAAEILRLVFGDATDDQRTFVQLAEAHLARPPRPNSEPDSIIKEARRVRSICRARWARELVADLKPKDIQLWLDGREIESSGSTANRDRAKISAIFRWGIPRGFATENPVRATTKYPEAQGEKVFWLTPTEVIHLLEVSPPRLRTFIVIATQTALRRGAIKRLCWTHFDFEGGYVNPPRGRGTKATPPRLRMTPALRSELLAHRSRSDRTGGEAPLFESAIDTIRDDLRRARAACEKIAPERRRQIGFHALRHTAASWMVQDGVPLYEVAKILGHGTVYVTARYAHLVPDFAKRGTDSLGSRLRVEDLPATHEGAAPGQGGQKPKSPPDSAGASAVAS